MAKTIRKALKYGKKLVKSAKNKAKTAVMNRIDKKEAERLLKALIAEVKAEQKRLSQFAKKEIKRETNKIKPKVKKAIKRIMRR